MRQTVDIGSVQPTRRATGGAGRTGIRAQIGVQRGTGGSAGSPIRWSSLKDSRSCSKSHNHLHRRLRKVIRFAAPLANPSTPCFLSGGCHLSQQELSSLHPCLTPPSTVLVVQRLKNVNVRAIARGQGSQVLIQARQSEGKGRMGALGKVVASCDIDVSLEPWTSMMMMMR